MSTSLVTINSSAFRDQWRPNVMLSNLFCICTFAKQVACVNFQQIGANTGFGCLPEAGENSCLSYVALTEWDKWQPGNSLEPVIKQLGRQVLEDRCKHTNAITVCCLFLGQDSPKLALRSMCRHRKGLSWPRYIVALFFQLCLTVFFSCQLNDKGEVNHFHFPLGEL